MSLLDRAIARPGALLHHTHTRAPLLRPPSSSRRCFYAKVKLDDEEQDQNTSHRGFNIRVPTMPKLGDIESARRLLESAFQNLSFDMPKLPIDSALQGLPLGISKLSTPVRILVLDITGFVVTKLKKPPKKALEETTVLDEKQYPRCAWPRMVKGSQVDVVANIGLLENLKEQEASYQIPVGPHCAWPRATGQITQASGLVSSPSVVSDELYPRSAWPRGSILTCHVVLGGQQLNKLSVIKEEEASPCIIEGGPRCAWPRKGITAKQSYYGVEKAANAEELEGSQGADANDGKAPRVECDAATGLPTISVKQSYGAVKNAASAEELEVSQGADADDLKGRPAKCDAATELPRRMLATSVGLTVMNHLAKGSIATSIFDLCSLLPAGSLDIPEGEGEAMDLGRRTLLVFIKSSGG